MKHIKLFESFVFEKENTEKPWWEKYKKYQLSAYPVNIPEVDVTVDISGDINSHPVLTWNSPTTGKKVYAYTRERMNAQQEQKYLRIGDLSDEEVERIKAKCHEDILSPKTEENIKEAAAIVAIIAQTGLRPGSKKGFLETENRGVITLSKDNIAINENKITLNFIGKSYKENTAEIEDGILANFLQTLMDKTESDFIFSVSKEVVENYYKNTLHMEKFKIKDLRTYMANKIAKWFLETDNSTPPPVPDQPTEIKKLVKNKLKRTFEFVSKKLNNTPAMAKNSYVNPAIITNWLALIGIKPSIITEDKENSNVISKKIIGNVPVYELPNWWDDDEIELIKTE